jgi:hypothetical protein
MFNRRSLLFIEPISLRNQMPSDRHSPAAQDHHAIADWIMTPVPPGGSAVGLNSRVGPCSDPDQGMTIPATDQDFPVPISKEFSLAGFELIQRLGVMQF